MRILQLCKKFPFPTRDGETLAISYLARALAELGCEITLLSMNTSKHHADTNSISNEMDHYESIHYVELDNDIKIKDAFLNLFSKDSYHVSRYINQDFEKKLIQLLKKTHYDVVQLETLFLAPYIPTIKKHSTVLVTMRAHNVEFEIWERLTEQTRFLPKKLYLKYLTNKLRNFELDTLNTYDYMIPVTDRDLDTFKRLGYKNGAFTSPIGLDIETYMKYEDKEYDPSSFSICFIGALDWMPNLHGVEWFLDCVWPRINATNQKVVLNIAGRHTPQSLKKTGRHNVKVYGEIKDAISFIHQNDIMIVPIFSGSGMRVKILEGMALGKVVITTSLGMEGIDGVDKKEILIANDPDEFFKMIEFCYYHPDEMQKIGRNAREFVRKHYDNKKNARSLIEIYNSLIHSSSYS